MNMFWAVIFLPMGLVILLKGADFLVDGAVGLAKRFGLSRLVIGLTVVAMGTSAPEVAASITAAMRGFGDTAIGNVYGSNIANLAFVGGLSALICPIVIRQNMSRLQLPIMLIVALLLWPILAIDLRLDRGESVILLVVFIGLLCFTIITALRQTRANPQALAEAGEFIKSSGKSLSDNIFFIVLGLAALALGADLAVRGGVFIGLRLGLSEAVIGITIIAIGTSLPELMTCVVAACKGHSDLSIGNLVGSNVFNTLLVVGTAGAIRPFGVNARLTSVDYWIMVGVSAVFVLIAVISKKISRKAGTFLLAGYIAYMVYLLVFTREI